MIFDDVIYYFRVHDAIDKEISVHGRTAIVYLKFKTLY